MTVRHHCRIPIHASLGGYWPEEAASWGVAIPAAIRAPLSLHKIFAISRGQNPQHNLSPITASATTTTAVGIYVHKREVGAHNGICQSEEALQKQWLSLTNKHKIRWGQWNYIFVWFFYVFFLTFIDWFFLLKQYKKNEQWYFIESGSNKLYFSYKNI